jgi:hypothetical protein
VGNAAGSEQPADAIDVDATSTEQEAHQQQQQQQERKQLATQLAQQHEHFLQQLRAAAASVQTQ